MLTLLQQTFPVIKGMLDFAFPPLCAGCGAFLEEEGDICDYCRAKIDWYQTPFMLANREPVSGDTAYGDTTHGGTGNGNELILFAAGDYSDPLREIVINFKFRGVTGIAGCLADKIVSQFGDGIAKLGPVELVPIPLHPSREYSRGYNQATLLAEEVGRLLDLPVNDQILVRTEKRKPQSRLKESERERNIKGVFTLVDCDTQENGCNIVLVDDVVTSGQTVFEARRVLTKAGYRVPAVISMAHGL